MSEREHTSIYFEAFLGVFGPGSDRVHLSIPPELSRNDVTLLARSSNLAVAGLKERSFPLQLSAQRPWSVVAAKGRPFPLNGALDFQLSRDRIESDLKKLDGRFCIAAAGPDQLILATDVLGASAIYYYQNPAGLIYFSTHLGILVASLPTRPHLDDLGIAAMLAGSCCINGRTVYEGIRRLKAAQYLGATRDGGSVKWSISTYTSPADCLSGSIPPFEHLDRRFGELLCAAVDRERCSGDYALMLSAGLDSRAIALALVLNGNAEIDAATYGEWRSWDMRGARAFAARHEMRHFPLPYGDWKMGSEARTIAALSGGNAGLQVEHNSIGFKRAAKHFRRVAVGFLGGTLTGANLPKNGRTEYDVILNFKRLLREEVKAIFRDELHEIESEIASEKDALSGLSNTQKNLLLDWTIRQATWISTTFDQCGWYLPICFPFYNRELMKFCFGLGREHLENQRLYRSWVTRETSSTARNLIHRRNLSWLVDESRQRFLDIGALCVPRMRAVSIIDWKMRTAPLLPWLRDLCSKVESAKLRSAMEAQLKPGTSEATLLLTGGAALGTLGFPYDDENSAAPFQRMT